MEGTTPTPSLKPKLSVINQSVRKESSSYQNMPPKILSENSDDDYTILLPAKVYIQWPLDLRYNYFHIQRKIKF